MRSVLLAVKPTITPNQSDLVTDTTHNPLVALFHQLGIPRGLCLKQLPINDQAIALLSQ